MARWLNAWLFKRHLEDDETVVLLVHKHWLLGLRLLFWPSLTIAVSWVFLYFAPFQTILYAVSLFTVFVLVWWLRNFFDYYLDAWLVTDHGIIDVEWHGWFHRQSSRVLYSDLQGVSYEIQGVFATMMGFGTISVEKISTGQAISMDHVPRPRRIEGIILQRMEGYLHKQNLKDAKTVQTLLSSVIARELQMQELGEKADA